VAENVQLLMLPAPLSRYEYVPVPLPEEKPVTFVIVPDAICKNRLSLGGVV
jgi:hypothetical protein